MLPELLVVFTLSSADSAPALADDIFVYPRLSGQYYLHVEASQATMHSNHPGKVDFQDADEEKMDEGLALFEVEVNFDPNSVQLAKDMVRDIQGYLSNGHSASYATMPWIKNNIAEEVLDAVEADSGTLIPIASTKSTASWLEASRIGLPEGYSNMQINYNQIDDDRVLRIRGFVLSDDITVDDIKGKVDELIAQYKDLPVRRYTGSIVE